MKLTDVVKQLQAVLPKYTDYFNDTLTVDTITATSTVATITTIEDNNFFSSQKAVTNVGITQETPIISVSQDGLVFNFETSIDHDLTLNFQGYENVTLGGFTDSSWNDSFVLVDVPNRRNFKVRSSNTIPTLNANEYLAENRIDGVNGRFLASITVDPKVFTIEGDFLAANYTGGIVKKDVRIAGSISFERAIEQYTKQNVNDLWMFVVMKDAEISKDRNAYNDAVATIANGEDLRLRLIDGFEVYIVKNVKEEVAAVESIDICRHDLLSPILKSLFGARFSTGTSRSGDFVAVLTNHNVAFYNRATFAYQYDFEFTYDLVLEDSVEQVNTRAFRDIEYATVTPTDTENLTVEVNLDDEPL
jgi:hypothetical protein